MKRIMFICHGNICRSPMAEFILKKMVREKGLEDDFVISSSATSTEEIWGDVGNPVYPPAKQELLKHGITCEGKRAVQLNCDDYNKYDLLICMDSRNVRNALAILGSDPEEKLIKLMDLTSKGGDVADPWYSGDFDTAYHDIELGCTALLEKMI